MALRLLGRGARGALHVGWRGLEGLGAGSLRLLSRGRIKVRSGWTRRTAGTVALIGTLLIGSLGLDGYLAGRTRPDVKANIANIHEVLTERPDWYRALRDLKTPKHVVLGTIAGESGFDRTATPGVRLWPPGLEFSTKPFPGLHWEKLSSGYGFSGAINGTWDLFKRATNRPNASRTDFGDSATFVDWYMQITHRRFGVPLSNVREQYLAYYMGWDDYARYKKGLISPPAKARAAANRAVRFANSYKRDLDRHGAELDRAAKRWWEKLPGAPLSSLRSMAADLKMPSMP